MTAALLTVGDELLIGQIVNGNAAWLGDRLGQAGVAVRESRVVGDEVAVVTAALADLWPRHDLVVVTGGLGPTHDDLTRDALARFFDAPLVPDARTMARIEALFARRGREMPERNRVQALVPAGFVALDNDHGTAPGLLLERATEYGLRRLIALPGVPREMQELVETHLAPRLGASAEDGGTRVIRHRTLLTAGVGESALADLVGDLDPWLDARTHLAFLPSAGTVRLRVSAEGTDAAEVDARAARFVAHLTARAGAHAVGEVPSGTAGAGAATLDAAVVARLAAAGRTIALAESCTGGLVMDRLTDVPGASAVLAGGIVAYDNAVKARDLGVSMSDLDTHGAVSEAVAVAMAEGVRARFGTTHGLSTTGIAGPGGGTDEKPVGTVWIGVATPHGTRARRVQFGSDRRTNKTLFATTALDHLRRALDDDA